MIVILPHDSGRAYIPSTDPLGILVFSSCSFAAGKPGAMVSSRSKAKIEGIKPVMAQMRVKGTETRCS